MLKSLLLGMNNAKVNMKNEQSTIGMAKAIGVIKGKIDTLLEAEKNYPEDIDDLNDYLGLICSINKLIKLKAIILANMMCEKDMMSFVKKEKYLYPVVECYSDTGRNITSTMIKYYMKYSKKCAIYVSYDDAIFETMSIKERNV